ncbi:MAG TPA: Rrf2 family transcriptional regulator [Planctomycetaceae bacterium]|nr:Rrf2 family transcriptional regulator [Planctomycetaceae bacterium]
MITQTVEYALRAMVTLAFRPQKAMTVQEIANVTRAPAPYLSKLMQGLVRARLVRSRRGQGGGFTLAGNPEEITIWDIVQAVDPIERIEHCPLEIKGHSSLCALHRRMDDAIASVEAAFRKSTLAEMIAESPPAGPLCREKEEEAIVPLGLLKKEDD